MEHQQFDQLLTEIREMKGDIQGIKQEQVNVKTELQKTNEKLFSLEENTNENFLSFEEKTNEKFLSLEEKTNKSFHSLEENTNKKFLSLEEKTNENFLSLEEKTNENFLSLEEKTNMIHLQAVELSEQHQEILSQLKSTAKKDDVAYTEKKILEHDREIFKIKKHLQMNS